VVQVAHVRRALGERLRVVPLQADVEHVRDAESQDVVQLLGGERVVEGVEVAADRQPRGDEVQVGRLGGR
jgi:hypothetical protein